METSSDEVNRLLRDWGGGDSQALERLMPLIYNELRQLAHRCLYGERPGHTLQTTALVHEAYLKLIDQRDARCQPECAVPAPRSVAPRQKIYRWTRPRTCRASPTPSCSPSTERSVD